MTHSKTKMTAEAVVKVLARRRTNQVVVSTMTIMAPWGKEATTERDLRCVGFMGGASTIGLGVALAKPEVPVWILDGDGSLAMQLGSLLTIANAQPANFIHMVFNNGVYDTSGAQPTLARDAMSFADMAKSAGYSDTYTFNDIETLDSAFDELMEAEGPILVELMTSPIGKGYVAPTHPETEPTPALALNWPKVRQALL